MQSLLNWEIIKALREAIVIDGKPMTQETAAARAGFNTRQRWNAIESGRKPQINLDTLGRLAVALECEPAKLLLPSSKPPAASSPSKPPRKRREPAHA